MRRLFLLPGVEVRFSPHVMLYADVEFPVYQRMTGNQLVAPALFKVIVSYSRSPCPSGLRAANIQTGP